ncbi:MAG: hypothetical protein OEV62_04305 [Actinomycetota bacterium]|nr:hypothetical protein [Actinomycetota bacterium]MDH4352915.1 hypothetical protein [Actinomycetota bacterium]
MRRALPAVLLVAGLVVTACGGTTDDPAAGTATPATSAEPHADDGHDEAAAGPRLEVRDGERLLTVAVPGGSYTPDPPAGATDDYHCFLLNPRLVRDAFVTGVEVLPGNAEVAHHAIVYRVEPAQVRAARQKDRSEPGAGWSCFGGPDLPSPDGAVGALDSAPWVAAWAPGGEGGGFRPGLGIPLVKGSRVVLQMHYNTRAGDGPDATRVLLRLAPGSSDLKALETVLLPAPVELPCAPGQVGPLCDRERAVLDLMARFGPDAGARVGGLGVLCGPDDGPRPGPTQTCDRPVTEPMTIYGAAGHMHLLGRSISITLNPGTPRERTVLDVPQYNFDDQGSRPLQPALRVRAGDVLRVQCTHDATLRDLLPELAGAEPRYVTWGEGTTDEMCLGILLVSRP